jgi:hypothetical protein
MKVSDILFFPALDDALSESLYVHDEIPGLGNLRIFKNPGRSEFNRVVSQFVSKEARGLLGPKGLFIWDAYLATHHDIRRKVGLGGERLILTLNEIKLYPYFSQNSPAGKDLRGMTTQIIENEYVKNAFAGNPPELQVVWTG